MLKRRVIVVRPYGRVIRDRMFRLLEELGCDMENAVVVEARTADADAVEEVLAQRASVLLVPFHGHRDETGQMIDGFSFLSRLVREKGSCPWRVVMPVSRYGRAGFMLSQARQEDPGFGGQLEVVIVEDLDIGTTEDRLRAHLG